MVNLQLGIIKKMIGVNAFRAWDKGKIWAYLKQREVNKRWKFHLSHLVTQLATNLPSFIIYHTHDVLDTAEKLPNVGRMLNIISVNGLAHQKFLLLIWLEHSTGNWEFIVSNPVEYLEFFSLRTLAKQSFQA